MKAAWLLVPALLILAGCRPEPPPADVLLITWDTVRADRVGIEGATPTWDRLVAEGVSFPDARTSTPVTLPAHTSLLTGLEPPRHGVRSNGLFALGDGFPTLAERFDQGGRHTAAFVSATVLDGEFGLGRGFAVYDATVERDPGGRHYAERPAGSTVDAALAWLDGVPSDEPVFVWVHLFDPHRPWIAPAEWAERFPGDPYQAEIAYTDHETGRLLDGWRDAGRDGRTVVALLADHGEGLGDHGERMHGYFAYDSTVRIPLVLWTGDELRDGVQAGVQLEGGVSITDVAPTVVDLAGLGEWSGDGVSLARPARGEGALAARELPLECALVAYEFGTVPVFGVIDEQGQAWFDLPIRERYDLAGDPGQLASLYTPEMAGEADALFARHARAWPPSEGGSGPSPEQRQQLLALGYLEPVAAVAGDGDGPELDPKRRLDLLELIQTGAAEYTPTAALAEVRRLTERFGRLPALWRMEVDLLDQLGQPERADALLQEVAAQRPDLQTVSGELEQRKIRREQDRRLAEAIRAALEGDPAHPTGHHDLALVLTRLGDLDGAADHYRAALLRDPADDESRRNLARVLVARDSLSEAYTVLAGGLDRPGHALDLDCDAGRLLGLHLDRREEALPLLQRCRDGGGQLTPRERSML